MTTGCACCACVSAALRAIAALAFVAVSQFADAGINAWTSTGPRSGWTMLAADPLVPGRVLAWSNAGTYQSLDGGEHWTSAPAVPWMQAVAFDPTVAGRVFGASPTNVFRSDDGGATWPFMASFRGNGFLYSGSWANIWRLQVSPHRNTDLYLTNGTLWYSNDAGATLTQIVSPTLDAFVYDFALDPGATGVIYVADHAHTVAKSTDNGATWTPAATGLPPGLAGLRLTIDPSNPSRMYLVAAPRDQSTSGYWFAAYSVYVSANAGQDWHAVDLALASMPWPEIQVLPAPGQPGTVYLRAGTRSFRSLDYGATWTQIALLHDDLAQSLAAGPGVVYAGGLGSGLQRSSDGGRSWNAANAGLPATGVGAVATIPGSEFMVLASTPGPAELMRRNPDGNGWIPSLLWPFVHVNAFTDTGGHFLAIDSGPYGFAGFTTPPKFGTALAFTKPGKALQSTDLGATWTSIGSALPELDQFATAASDFETIYACGAGHPSSGGHSWASGGLGRSLDGGRTWTALTTGTAYNFGCTALAVDPVKRDVAYLATNPDVGFRLLRTGDGGITWTTLPTPAALGSVVSILINPANAQQLIIAGSSTGPSAFLGNLGSGTWVPLGGLLPADVYLRTAVADWSATPSVLYAGTNRGVYATPLSPQGGPWTMLPGSQSLAVNDLQLARPASVPSRLTVIAATDRGVQEFTDDATGALAPVYRFYNVQTGAHFFTISRSERDHVVATWPQFVDEGVAFWALADAAPATVATYRFYDPSTGTHRYPASAAERDQVYTNSPQAVYEGVAYHALTRAEPGTLKVYRFRNAQTGAHLLTMDDDERDWVRRYLPQFEYEGIVQNAYPAAPYP